MAALIDRCFDALMAALDTRRSTPRLWRKALSLLSDLLHEMLAGDCFGVLRIGSDCSRCSPDLLHAVWPSMPPRLADHAPCRACACTLAARAAALRGRTTYDGHLHAARPEAPW